VSGRGKNNNQLATGASKVGGGWQESRAAAMAAVAEAAAVAATAALLELAFNSINAVELTLEFEIINRIMSQSSLLCHGQN
jgi:hypothetical protein